MICEGYRIELTHYIVDIETGKRIKLDEPIVVEQVFDRTHGGSPIILNRMFAELEKYLLERVAK